MDGFYALIESDNDERELPSNVNFATLDESHIPLLDQNYDHTFKELANRSFYHSLFENYHFQFRNMPKCRLRRRSYG